MNRNRRIEIRITSEEAEKLKNTCYARGITQSEFLRGAIHNRIPNKKLVKELLRFNNEIRKIGININQIAKHCNQTGRVNEIYLLNYLNSLDKLIIRLNEIVIEENGGN